MRRDVTHERFGWRVPGTGRELLAVNRDRDDGIVGMAQGAVEALAARLRGTAGPGATADSVALQLRLAESSAEVDAARTLHRADVREMLDRGARAEALTELDRARFRRDKAYVTKLCVSAVNRLFEAAGARAVYDSEPLQRFHRDIHTASHHTALVWDPVAEQFGQAVKDRPYLRTARNEFTMSDKAGDTSAHSLSEVLTARSDIPYEKRIEVARLIVDLSASYQAGWYSLIIFHGGGSPEAMKMEIRIHAPREGVIQKLWVKQGQTVEREQVLIEIE